MHYGEVSGYYDNLKIAYDEYNAENKRIGIRYNYLHEIPGLNFFKLFKVYAGGGIHSFINYSRYTQNTRTEVKFLADPWYASHSLEFSLLVDVSKNKSDHFSLQLFLPVISDVSRPSYTNVNGLGLEQVFKLFGEIAPLWKNFLLQFKIRYEHNINKSIGISIHYDFQYSTYNQPRLVSMFMNNFKAGAYFIF